MTEIDERILGSVRFYVDHGLIIVEDPDSGYGHDEWDPANEFVSAGPDSLYLSVQPSVDGPVEVVISKAEIVSQRASHLYFDGNLHLKGRYVVVHDADDVMRFSVRRSQGSNRVRVMVDEPGFVSYMVVMFLSAEPNPE
jgi:hypothetical protein